MFDPYAHSTGVKKVEIVPAVLPKNFKDLEDHVLQIAGKVKRVQVDIVDGVYAHGTTWPYRDHGTFDTIVSQEKGLPHWDELNYEFDLMISIPAQTWLIRTLRQIRQRKRFAPRLAARR